MAWDSEVGSECGDEEEESSEEEEEGEEELDEVDDSVRFFRRLVSFFSVWLFAVLCNWNVMLVKM